MANDKLDMSGFVKDIRERQALDKPEQQKPATPVNSESTIQNSELKKMGRPKKTRKIEGGAQVSLFFDQDTKMKMMMAKLNHKIEMKDLILGATILFLDKYYENGELSERGQRELEKVLDKVYGE
jgi:hypothetical protein